MTSYVATWPASRVSRVLHHKVVAHLLFWSWNLNFVAFVTAGLAPRLVADFVRDTVRGVLPAGMAATLAVLVLLPPVCTVVGLVWLRRRPEALLRLFYGLEMPLFFLALMRLFLVREMTLPQLLLGAAALGGIVAFALELSGKGVPHSRSWTALVLVLLTLLVAVGAYAGLVLLFYTVPLGWMIVREVIRFHWITDLAQAFTSEHALILLLFAVLFAYSLTLLLALPIVAPVLYFRSWWRALVAVRGLLGRRAAILIPGATAVTLAAVVALASRQPQAHAFAALTQAPANDAERRANLAEQEEVADGLINAYLWRYRYLDAAQSSETVSNLYGQAFGGSWPRLQKAHALLASPWLYDGSAGEAARASDLYEAFFDTPVQRGEREAVRHALNSTYDRTSVQAGLLDEDADRVWLRSQAVEVTEHGDWAEVELHETYENRTFEQQEVLYHFALPESAALTGLWLGSTPDREQAFAFTVAPRGAAQRVYRDEVRRRVDPALLEQTGPRQYRLRAFPITARDQASGEASAVHLWMRFAVFARGGAWPMPQLLERRNVFWDRACERLVRGERVARPFDGWLWPELKALGDTRPRPHRVALEGGSVMNMVPAALEETAAAPLGRLVVVIDRSYSMAQCSAEMVSSIEALRRRVGFATIDWVLTSAPSRGEPARLLEGGAPFDPTSLVYYGGQSGTSLLQQLAEVRGNRAWDAAIVLTDGGGYELEKERPELRDAAEPLWIVHLGSELPVAYADALLAQVQHSGGGIALSVEEALPRIAVRRAAGAADLVDGYRVMLASGAGDASAEQEPLAMAARTAIGLLARDPEPATSMDELHRLAKSYTVVTPYSSMIVLVNEEQLEALRRASESADRFDRYVETGKEALTAPFAPEVSGVPEPHEWLLIGCAAALLLYRLRRRRTELWA